ncbi:GT2 family glycosyltransferase [Nitrospirillum amazonense]|uniref:GT2 family glycosyltransferase n=1 Tax=Nitrospirillum amazonense TaxID=28077 RepID=A0A560FSH4_9PROT|nr:glycosyltransferase [Nitrospirillum amazonense]TWB24553.1 GT2 family glycosyltransferase [Nitrospirillum amazonense]
MYRNTFTKLARRIPYAQAAAQQVRALFRGTTSNAPELSADYTLVASSPLFDKAWYLSAYADVAAADLDPLRHYLEHGAQEGRLPGLSFDGRRYYAANPDVAAAGINPLVHYLRHGIAEGRLLAPLPTKNTTGCNRAAPAYWYHVGDSIDWLEVHKRITGVGRVSIELLFSFIDNPVAATVIPCVFGESESGVVPATADDVELLAKRTDRSLANQPLLSATATKHNPKSPVPGDHIFFTGLVWTPLYTEKFRRLQAVGVDYSVLVHDVIPLEEPALVGVDYHEAFSEWLSTVLTGASVVYVSSDYTRQKIFRFAVLRKIKVKPAIIVIKFGLRAIGAQAGKDTSQDRAGLAAVDWRGFVLSVGTIDERKNQIFLCRLWRKLADALGEETLPQLVLAGRDDLKVAQVDDIAAMVASGKILILENMTDAQISGLYRHCLFTAFPSTCEGYGLPVAESLVYGKLCLCSDLPEIRAHAGDFAWYFPASDMDAALALFTRALGDQAALQAAEDHIRDAFVVPQWHETFLDMLDAAAHALQSPVVLPTPIAASFPGAREIDVSTTLAKAARYCTDQEPEVSILIINWNAAALTLECLRQIWSQTEGHTYEIIIADNGSAPTDVAMLRNLGPGVRLLALGTNRYFGEANNIAAEAAQGRYVCLLNNDAFVQPDWLTALVAPFQVDTAVGATGPLFLYPDGVVQEAGGIIDANGYPIRLGRGDKTPSLELLKPKFVNYISAAALMIPRDIFMEVGGFDLAYEPAYYEDTDLCMKIQAMGYKVLYCPDAQVIHIEGAAANGDTAAEARRKALGDLNRDKFLARWGRYLKTRRQSHLIPVRHQFLPSAPLLPALATGAARPKAVVYTPYELTPGGGERFLLTLAMTLSEQYAVTVVTPWRYSRLRLRNLGCEFDLDLSRLDVMTEAEFQEADQPDLMVTLGNHIIPTAPARGKANIYICQFPFPMHQPVGPADREVFAGYQKIVVYSNYTKFHIFANLSAYQLPDRPVEVLYPPVPLFKARPATKKRMILTVGRYFVGGHSKRHDVLIDIFKKIAPQFSEPVELHVAGSSMPGAAHMDYLAQLRAAAVGHPIHIHVNVSAEMLQDLYHNATVYWHGTGIGADLSQEPGKAEHFGITVVEAMSAGTVPFALNSAGPREIITDGETGFLYDTTETLAEKTLTLFSKSNTDQLSQMGAAATARAQAFSQQVFVENVKKLVSSIV